MLNYTIYRIHEDSSWVTFIHGAGGSSNIWFKQIRDFSKFYNILLIDLRGHGKSANQPNAVIQKKYSFEYVINDVIEVLNFEKIDKSHFVGISLGTILIRKIAQVSPEKIETMIMGGAIIKLNVFSQVLMHFGNFFKSILPYLWIYKIFAFIIMPYKNHRESRSLFIREAKKLCQKEFVRWYKLTAEVIPLLSFFRKNEVEIPILYLMGNQDRMFLPSVIKSVKNNTYSELIIVPDCGHVVNVEKPDFFNKAAIDFIKKNTL